MAHSAPEGKHTTMFMKIVSRTWALAIVCSSLVMASAVSAQQAPVAPEMVQDAPTFAYPVTNAQRPVTLSAGLLRIDAGLGFSRFCLSDGAFCSDVAVALSVGAGYGITEDFEVGATVLPLLLSPDFDYGDPSIYAQYRVARGDVEVAIAASVFFPVLGDFRASIGAPIWIKASPSFALRTGAFVTFADNNDLAINISVPVLALFNLSESFWLGLDTGFSFNVTDPGPGDTFAIPLGLQLGYTVPGNNGAPLLDIAGSFGFPLFLLPGSAGDVVFTDLWTAGLGVRIYLDTQG